MAGLGAYSEGELDTWFATRGVSRADLREQFLPFGDGLWFERFPRYANALRGDLGAYEALLGQAMTRRGGDRDTLGLASRMAAIEDARITVRTLLADGRLREVTSLRLSYRLSLEYLSLFEPAVDTYRLPPFAGEAYNVGNDEEVSIGDVARIAAGLESPALPIKFETSQDRDYLSDNPQRRCPDLTDR